MVGVQVLPPVSSGLIMTACLSHGMQWRDNAEKILADPRVQATYEEVYAESDKAMDYPAYYTQPFHAYDTGNLNWLAAAEVESATASMCLRVGRGCSCHGRAWMFVCPKVDQRAGMTPVHRPVERHSVCPEG
jgi:hypothetical protein